MVHEQLHQRDFAHFLKIAQIFLDNPVRMILLPPSVRLIGPRQKRFRESAEAQQRFDQGGRRRGVQFAQGEGVKSVVVISALKRISAFAVIIQHG